MFVHLRHPRGRRGRGIAAALALVGVFGLTACETLVQRAVITRDGARGSDRMGYAVAVSNDGTTMAVGSPFVATGGKESAGVVTVYAREVDVTAWTKVTEFAAALPSEEGRFGSAVALSGDGNTLVVGASNQNSKGSAVVFRRVDGEWDRGKTLGVVSVNGDGIGYSVSISDNGKVVAVGAPFQSVTKSATTYTNAGRVWIYEDVAGVWTLRTFINASILQKDENFGSAVALSGDGSDLVVGLPGFDMLNEAKRAVQEFSGRSELFRRTGNAWNFSTHLSDADTVLETARVGASVAFSGDGSTIAVGAPGYDTSVADIGAVITYKKVNNGWERIATLSSNAYAGAFAGSSVALTATGDHLVVGAAEHNVGVGAVVLMKRNNLGYEVSHSFTDASATAAGGGLGRSVAISDDAKVIIGGAPFTTNWSGAVHAFDRFTKPTEPSAVVATAANGAALVSWTAPADNGGLSPTYTVTSNPDGKTCVTTATSCILAGLTNGTPYTFRVSARNAVGTSQASVASAAVVPSASASIASVIGTVPGAPTAVKVVPGWRRAAIAWTAPVTDGGQRVHSFTVTASPGGQTCTTNGATSCTIIGLNARKQHSFSVVAINAIGSSAAATSEKYALQPKVSLRTGPTAVKLAGWQGIASGIGEIVSMKLVGKAAKANCKIVGGTLVAKVAQADCKVRVKSRYAKTLTRTVLIRTVRG